MQCAAQFLQLLQDNGVTFFTGVPDSLLKDFCACVQEKVDPKDHIIAANEGCAVSLAAGYHLATGNIGLVYMQNSGLGNSVNPLTSLVDPDVYSIPVLLLIGWRGEPGKKDEPQHVKQGRVTLSLLDALEIPYEILDDTVGDVAQLLATTCERMREEGRPRALVVRDGFFSSFACTGGEKETYPLIREQAVQLIVNALTERDVVVSTTGKTSRELFEYRKALGHGHGRDFLTVGSMGLCSQIALGIALQKPERRIVCIDGDGAAIMHTGGLATIGTMAPANYLHIIINNGSHDSVGGQPTVGFDISFPGIARSCGYREARVAQTAEEITAAIREMASADGPSLLEIRVAGGARKDLGRPTTTPRENKKAFMDTLSG